MDGDDRVLASVPVVLLLSWFATRLPKPSWHFPPKQKDLEGIYGRNKESKEFLEFPNSLDGLGPSKRNDYQRNSKEFLQVPPKP
jgi:hypothetical protein